MNNALLDHLHHIIKEQYNKNAYDEYTTSQIKLCIHKKATSGRRYGDGILWIKNIWQRY